MFNKNDIVIADKEHLIGRVCSITDGKITMVEWLNLVPHQILNGLINYYTFRHATKEETAEIIAELLN
jgi:hypothetical protein